MEICVWGDFQRGITVFQSSNIEIGVRGDLDYSPGQSLLVRRDLTWNPQTRCVIYFGTQTSPWIPPKFARGSPGVGHPPVISPKYLKNFNPHLHKLSLSFQYNTKELYDQDHIV